MLSELVAQHAGKLQLTNCSRGEFYDGGQDDTEMSQHLAFVSLDYVTNPAASVSEMF